jgi:hypothetical protein
MTCCGISFGLDPVIGLIPGIGDVITAWMAMRLVRTAATANLPKSLVSHMTMNVMIDFLVIITSLLLFYISIFIEPL